MHKVFGTKENVKYMDREGAYLILVHDSQVGIIQHLKDFSCWVEDWKTAKAILSVLKGNAWKKQDV